MDPLYDRKRRILITGCGRIGSRLGLLLTERGHTVWGFRRHPGQLPERILPLRGDLTSGEGLSNLPSALDLVIHFPSTGVQTAEAFKAAYSEGVGNLMQALTMQRQKLERIFFISSTGVYAQQNGEWVDEQSPARPTHAAGRHLVEGENRVHRGPYPATVVRFAGIYGPQRVSLLERVADGRECCSQDRSQYTNLIHQSDCVLVLDHLIHIPEPERLYLAVDSQPVDRCTLITWLASELETRTPGTAPSGALSTRSLRSNKRCSNHLLLKSGYQFKYPDFKSGYRPLIEIFKRTRPATSYN